MFFTYINKKTKYAIRKIRAVPRRYYVFGLLFVSVSLLVLLFWPRHVVFSYQEKTCFSQPALLPGLLRSESDKFRLEPDKRLDIGGVTVASLNMCVTPVEAPRQGTVTLHSQLLGLSWIRKAYTVAVPSPPSAITNQLGGKPLSTVRPVGISLTSSDVVFDYKIRVGGKSVSCGNADERLVCDLAPLSLGQGKDYLLELDRFFNGTKIATIAKRPIKTLAAINIVSSSIGKDQLVYAKPRQLELITDKTPIKGSIFLERIDADGRQRIPIQIQYGDKKIVVGWNDDLQRQAKFELTVEQLVADDGSGLDGAYAVPFEMSGGPKVKSINIGAYGVSSGAIATVTFDQPLLATQWIAESVAVSGGATARVEGGRLLVSFANVARCSDVTIRINDKLQSEHGITGGSAWRYGTRTLCQERSVIGASVQGRPIVAYSFGGGANSIVYTGMIHGNEASTRLLMLRWVDELEANIRQIPADKKIVVVPVINPDGFASGRRTNAHNVDLNRNFATADWRSDITTTANAPFPKGGGESAMSEPETKALANLVGRLRPRLVLSYHSIGGLLAANQFGDSGARAVTYSRLSGYRNTTGSSDTFEYGISGTADDYYGEAFGMASILVELGSHTDSQFARNRDAMWAMVR